MTRYYNAWVKIKLFYKGYLILHRAEISKFSEQGKLASNLEGPYQITKMIHPRVYRIENLDGSTILQTWNVENFRMYYQ